ncbi:MAG TPA: deoxynucleoside kinase, partial [Saprospiraceae bacterium]|nr:deoxynucleoside kinase [Saprospiraceae bacterium]
MSLDYLKRLNQRYENWIDGYKEGKLLIINIDEIDFINKPEDFGFIINQIEAEIGGLFNII